MTSVGIEKTILMSLNYIGVIKRWKTKKAYVLTTKESPFKRDENHDTQNAILEGDFDLDLVPVEGTFYANFLMVYHA